MERLERCSATCLHRGGSLRCENSAGHAGPHATTARTGRPATTLLRWEDADPDLAPAKDGEIACGVVTIHKRFGVFCTRPRGHAGDHVAHNLSNKPVKVWPQEPPTSDD